MPHISIEYSDNLNEHMDMSELCELMRQSAIQTGLFPLAGIRVRAIACDHYAIADGHSDRYFIDIAVRLRAGRPLDKRKEATALLFETAQTHLSKLLASMPLALSMEMRDIDPELSPKTNSIRQFIGGDS